MFQNKVAIITGGGSGIGRCLCLDLASQGAHVVVTDINLANATETVAAIETNGGSATAVELDVTDAAAVDHVVNETVSQYGRLDYFFNNAGTTVIGEVRDLDLPQWRRVIDVNLWGAIHGTTAAYRIMVKQGFGHIVNVASGFGMSPGPTLVPYATSKFAVVGLSESLRAEARDLGVRVSVACPGYVQTNMLQNGPAVRVRNIDVLRQIPFKLMDVEECARQILQGVRKNKPVIAFPFYNRFLILVYRLFPRISARLVLQMVRNFRQVRAMSHEEAPTANSEPKFHGPAEERSGDARPVESR